MNGESGVLRARGKRSLENTVDFRVFFVDKGVVIHKDVMSYPQFVKIFSKKFILDFGKIHINQGVFR